MLEAFSLIVVCIVFLAFWLFGDPAEPGEQPRYGEGNVAGYDDHNLE